jgi:hypothetical protein
LPRGLPARAPGSFLARNGSPPDLNDRMSHCNLSANWIIDRILLLLDKMRNVTRPILNHAAQVTYPPED